MAESGRKIQSFTFSNGLNVKSKQAIYQTGFLIEPLCSKRSERLTENSSYSNVTLQLILYIFLITESFWSSLSFGFPPALERPRGRRHCNPCC